MKRWIVTLFLISLMGLTGCLEKSENDEAAVEKKDAELEQHIEETIPDEKEEIPQVTKPAVVTIVDPITLEIIHTLSPKELGYETDVEFYKLKLEKIAKELARGTETEQGYDQKMILDKLGEDGQVINGSPLVILKESELVEKILAASISGEDVELPLYVTESNYKTEDIPSLDEVIVASFTTYFNPSDVGRNKNIELSAKALNNVIIGSGDHFSFNTMVGPRTEATGYQPAPEIVNKKLVMGIGGGICQTSSTLFNAVDHVPVNIVERHHHSLSVGYVPQGRDATVSYGTLDFRFQNISGAPLLITTIYGHGVLTVEVRTAKKYEAKL
ncbi:VanW family protein [Solibacillus sp. FSL H8-0538]|uniref:VanW family protein n=1 Tax=Solibacillus sp. FSL H8-0538 TaxID=2921400 RepID=UPI0030FCF890